MTPGFNDGMFDEAAGWIPHGTDPAHLQRYRIRDGRIYCETILAIHANADRIMDRLMGRWTWWRKGLAMDFQRHGDGSTEQVLAPVWWYWARIRIRAYAPVPSPERGGLRIPMSLSGTWVGPSTFDIFPDAGRPAWSLLRAGSTASRTTCRCSATTSRPEPTWAPSPARCSRRFPKALASRAWFGIWKWKTPENVSPPGPGFGVG